MSLFTCTSEKLRAKEILNSQWNLYVAYGYMSQIANLTAIVVILVLTAAVSCVIKHGKVCHNGSDVQYSYCLGDELKENPKKYINQ